MDELSGKLAAEPDARDREVFRSPAATVVWWVWLVFAVANLIDIAVQGRDHLSVVAAATLLVVTGVVYVTALRPKVVADEDGLTIVNPVRDHRVGWAAVAGYDTTDLLRVRCVWPAVTGAAYEAGAGSRAIYCWAVHSSRRKALLKELRAQRGGRPGSISGRAQYGGFRTPATDTAPPPKPLGLDADSVIAALTAHADRAKAQAPEPAAVPPVSVWQWSAIAAVVIPVILLLIAVLA